MKLEFIWNLVLGKLGHCENNQAFTLIEVLITLGIFIFIISFALGVGLDTFARTSINDERDTVVFLLSKVRARALNNINQSAHGFRVDSASHEYVVYEVGPPVVEERTPFNDNYAITGGPIVFDQLSGRFAGGPETITITGSTGSESVTVNSEGGISW